MVRGKTQEKYFLQNIFVETKNVITGRNEVVAKVMFLHVSVILLTGGVSGETPPPRDQGEPPPRTKETPPAPGRHPPPRREEHCSIRSMSGRYASYWNAFLFG